MRMFVVLVCSWLLAYGDGGFAERGAAVEATGSVRAALEETISRAEAMARSIPEILLPAALMRPAEEEELRRYLVPAPARWGCGPRGTRRWPSCCVPGC